MVYKGILTCRLAYALGVVACFVSIQAQATGPDSVQVAVATNFVRTFHEITAIFSTETQIAVTVVTGSTGKLYAQIVNGMHVDLLLAADRKRVDLLGEKDLILSDTRMTYAIGRLAWWHPHVKSIQDMDMRAMIPIEASIRTVAMAQPALAPYGTAAAQALNQCFQYDPQKLRFVYGENIGQTFAQVATGNADAGLVALASIKTASRIPPRSFEVIPSRCHLPIKQDAAVLKFSSNPIDAKLLLKFMSRPLTKKLIRQAGYSTE